MKFMPEPPHLGWTYGFRNPTEELMRVQAWLSIAHGVTGFVWFPYATDFEPNGIAPFAYNDTWRATPVLDYLGRIHEPITRVATLLLKLKLLKEKPREIVIEGKDLYVGWFKFRNDEHPGYCLVPVNQSESKSCEVTFDAIPGDFEVHDLVLQELCEEKTITLAPGEGRLIYIGPSSSVNAIQEMNASPR